jgi:nitrogenase-stabilizing/protective protein
MPITLPTTLQELSSAEDFLDHFGIPFDPKVVQVSRLHILKRFHDYLESHDADTNGDEAALSATISELLQRAYTDFVRSDPMTERVFKVHKDAREKPATVDGRIFVPLAALASVPEQPKD